MPPVDISGLVLMNGPVVLGQGGHGGTAPTGDRLVSGQGGHGGTAPTDDRLVSG